MDQIIRSNPVHSKVFWVNKKSISLFRITTSIFKAYLICVSMYHHSSVHFCRKYFSTNFSLYFSTSHDQDSLALDFFCFCYLLLWVNGWTFMHKRVKFSTKFTTSFNEKLFFVAPFPTLKLSFLKDYLIFCLVRLCSNFKKVWRLNYSFTWIVHIQYKDKLYLQNVNISILPLTKPHVKKLNFFRILIFNCFIIPLPRCVLYMFVYNRLRMYCLRFVCLTWPL